MSALSVRATYIGGPTALLEIGGVRLLTDPTFDPSGTEYHTPFYKLRKTIDPAVTASELGRIDAVLLSHDHHFDNLDHAGRTLLPRAQSVLTTLAGADRLRGNAVGLSPWTSIDLPSRDGALRVTATPARHGPADGDRGPVIGFLLTDAAAPESPATPAVYISGDTVWHKELCPIAHRVDVQVAVLFLGAARVREVGPAHLTFNATEALAAARTFANAVIVPLHYSGWAHFSEGREEIDRAFEEAGMRDRLCWLLPARSTLIRRTLLTERDAVGKAM